MPELVECMCRYIGQTVTIFATCGGLSGTGFTGVLISCDGILVRLLTDMGAAPACPVGSACTGPVAFGGGYWGGCNPLGAIVTIPVVANKYTQLDGVYSRYIYEPERHGGLFGD